MTQPKAKPTTTGTEPGEMAAARREREGGRRRAEILTAARKILQEEGIVALSFPTKEDLLLTLFHHVRRAV